ncbi:MAG: orotate phosphoribosyltransferase [Nonlabens sp.]
MVNNRETAIKVADLLLQIKAIKLQPQAPFTWASGALSPIYCDNRIALSYPEARTYIKHQFCDLIKSQFKGVDVIAGVATGAIGIGALIADQLDLPFIYVRPEAKKHGRKNQIEGQLEPGQKVVVIEDLISTGGSSLNAVKAIKQEEGYLTGMLAIFSYGFDVAKNSFETQGVSLTTLSNYDHLIQAAQESGHFSDGDLELLKKWRKDPQNWNK